MTFLDVKIARLQKNQRLINHAIEEKQEQQAQKECLPQVYVYEEVNCFNGMVKLSMPKDLFEECSKEEDCMIWNTPKLLNLILIRHQIEEALLSIEELSSGIEQFGRENNVYMEILEAWQEEKSAYTIQYTKSKMPTAMGELIQICYTLCKQNERVSLIFTYVAQEENALKPLIEYMLQHIV